MAEAKVTRKVAVIHLDLNEDEASVLADILQRVGGDPIRSRRQFADGVRHALSKVGYKGDGKLDMKDGSIYFYDRPRCSSKT